MHNEDRRHGGIGFRGDDLVLGRPILAPGEGTNRPEPVPQSFIGEVAVSPDGSRLFAVHVLGMLVSVVDLKSGIVQHTISLPAEPYTFLVSPDGSNVVRLAVGRRESADVRRADVRAEGRDRGRRTPQRDRAHP
jgi:hypothetical protein